MKEWAPSVGKTKQPKSDDKFYSDDEDEKEEEGTDSGTESSSSSEGLCLCLEHVCLLLDSDIDAILL